MSVASERNRLVRSAMSSSHSPRGRCFTRICSRSSDGKQAAVETADGCSRPAMHWPGAADCVWTVRDDTRWKRAVRRVESVSCCSDAALRARSSYLNESAVVEGRMRRFDRCEAACPIEGGSGGCPSISESGSRSRRVDWAAVGDKRSEHLRLRECRGVLDISQCRTEERDR